MAAAQWQLELKEAVNSVEELIRDGYLPRTLENEFLAVAGRFKLSLPKYYLSLIDKKNPLDPIALMALPQVKELQVSTAALRDPIGDLQYQVAPRLTHRYKNRALLHLTNLCPMYCRFCFRKNLMNEKEEELYAGDYDAALDYLQKHNEIREVIFTGGDPWMLSDDKLEKIISRIAVLAPHINVLRFHTRMPVTLPSRITDELLRAIVRPQRFQTVVVTHFNHACEMSAAAMTSIGRLRSSGILLLNQNVLLKNVNDNLTALKDLYLKLGDAGVLPYYLHQCDIVAGAEFFRTSIEHGQKLWRELRAELPGYLIPEYVLDIPGGKSKVPLGESFVDKKNQTSHEYEISYREEKISYHDIGITI